MWNSGHHSQQVNRQPVGEVDAQSVNRCSGFTLIELLVVISVIAILVALLLPAVQQARESARRSQCISHLHQIGIALHSYHDVHKTLPPGSILMGPSFPVQTGWGWATFILPQLEQAALYGQLDFDIGNAAGANRPLIGQPLAIYRCPSDPAPVTISAALPGGGTAVLAHGNYPGSDGMLAALSHVQFADVTDGLSHSLMAGEWTYIKSPIGETTSSWCGTVSDGVAYQYIASLPHQALFPGARVNASPGFHSHHSGGAHFLMGDGSVQFLGDSTDIRVYYALSTINGGETVANPF